MAAQKALAVAQINPDTIGCLISTSVMRDYIEPSTASLIHGNLKLPASCLNYDLGSACLDFVTGMVNIALMIEAGAIRRGLPAGGQRDTPPDRQKETALSPP